MHSDVGHRRGVSCSSSCSETKLHIPNPDTRSRCSTERYAGVAEWHAPLEVLHDTRPVLYGPRSGHLLRASAGVGGAAVGSEFDFRRYTADARYYRGLGGAAVVAVQTVVDVVDGTVPFERLPKLGGQSILARLPGTAVPG